METQTRADTIETIDFENQDFYTSEEAVVEYGEPVIEVLNPRVENETTITGRPVSEGLTANTGEDLSEAVNESYDELRALYSDNGLGKSETSKDFNATLGVALAAELEGTDVPEEEFNSLLTDMSENSPFIYKSNLRDGAQLYQEVLE